MIVLQRVFVLRDSAGSPALTEAGLLASQSTIADKCEILVHGFAQVGIIALVDEATGYERDRVAGSLARILEALFGSSSTNSIRIMPS